MELLQAGHSSSSCTLVAGEPPPAHAVEPRQQQQQPPPLRPRLRISPKLIPVASSSGRRTPARRAARDLRLHAAATACGSARDGAERARRRRTHATACGSARALPARLLRTGPLSAPPAGHGVRRRGQPVRERAEGAAGAADPEARGRGRSRRPARLRLRGGGGRGPLVARESAV